MNSDSELDEQIERIKHELSLYLKIAGKLRLPAEEIEKQVNKYLETLYTLQELKKK